MDEVWKSIYGYNGLYEVSNLGRIKSIRTKKSKILKPYKGSSGYNHIVLYKNKKAKTYDVHRIVAISFLDNKYNKEEVNHKNGNKEDNMVDNLEWVSRSENLLHRHKTLHIKGYWYKRKVPKDIVEKRLSTKLKNGIWNSKKVLCIETGEVFNSISDVYKKYNFLSQNVGACCRGIQKTAYGLHWNFL